MGLCWQIIIVWCSNGGGTVVQDEYFRPILQLKTIQSPEQLKWAKFFHQNHKISLDSCLLAWINEIFDHLSQSYHTHVAIVMNIPGRLIRPNFNSQQAIYICKFLIMQQHQHIHVLVYKHSWKHISILSFRPLQQTSIPHMEKHIHGYSTCYKFSVFTILLCNIRKQWYDRTVSLKDVSKGPDATSTGFYQ